MADLVADMSDVVGASLSGRGRPKPSLVAFPMEIGARVAAATVITTATAFTALKIGGQVVVPVFGGWRIRDRKLVDQEGTEIVRKLLGLALIAGIAVGVKKYLDNNPEAKRQVKEQANKAMGQPSISPKEPRQGQGAYVPSSGPGGFVLPTLPPPARQARRRRQPRRTTRYGSPDDVVVGRRRSAVMDHVVLSFERCRHLFSSMSQLGLADLEIDPMGYARAAHGNRGSILQRFERFRDSLAIHDNRLTSDIARFLRGRGTARRNRCPRRCQAASAGSRRPWSRRVFRPERLQLLGDDVAGHDRVDGDPVFQSSIAAVRRKPSWPDFDAP